MPLVKVIIQDRETKYYLSTNGCWVATETDARDFFSLLPAYHFARNFTSRSFKVVLYCAEDDYRAVIMEGEGNGAEELIGSADASWVDRFNGCMRSMRAELN